jgi:dihydrodipicolinate synthase/N-acetylneuraminate lyase
MAEETPRMRHPQRNLVACLLPWTPRFELDVDTFERHVQSCLDDGFTALYVMGTAGEGYAVDGAMYRQVVHAFARMTATPGVEPQVGVISLSMREVIRRVEVARDLGIRMFQISLPAWGAVDDEELVNYFTSVCGAFPDCRFLHYNLSRAGRVLSGGDYRRLADVVPNLVATKNSNDSYLRTTALVNDAPDLQHFLLETNFAMGCAAGACSLLCSFATLFPKTTHELFDAGLRGDFPALFRIGGLLQQATDLFAPLSRQMIDGGYDKTLAWLRDSRFPTRLLPPYVGPSSHELAAVRGVFEARYQHIS